MNGLFPVVASPRFSLALLLLRIVVGASFMVHGAPKLAHPLTWANSFPPSYPIHNVPAFLQLIVTITENLGGLCILLGFLTPLWAFLQACDMLVAGFYVKAGHGLPFVAGRLGGSFELESHLFVSALILLLCGSGLYAIDALLFRARDRSASRTYATG